MTTGKRYILLVDIITNAPRPLFLEGNLPNGIAGVPYSSAYVGTGGLAPLVYSVLGVLPAGLSIDSATGVVSGTPTETGSFSVTVSVTDAVNQVVSNADTFLVTETPVVEVSSPAPDATAAALEVPAWDPSKVPTDLTLSNSNRTAKGTAGGWRTLGGTMPRSSGKHAIRFTADTDGNGFFVGVCSKAINGTWPSDLPHNNTGGKFEDYGLWYSWDGAVIGANNGTNGIFNSGYWHGLQSRPMECLVDLDSSPPTIQWVRLDTNAVVYTLNLATGETWVPIGSQLNFAGLIIDSSSWTPTDAAYTRWGDLSGTPYSHTYTASGGTAPYTYAVTSGSLPPGLSLATNGALTGTPTTPGTYAFTVTATDATAVTGDLAESVTIS